jgi:hypothetical protein
MTMGTNADQILFRASGNGHIMVEPRSGTGLSESCKTYLTDVFVTARYGRNKDISNRYTNKGLMVEEDSITLYSRAKKNYFLKNEEKLSNQYVSGTPDLYLGENIHKAEIIIDIKSSWDIFTFFKAKTSPINKLYYWQLQTYMALTGAKSSKLVYCLINTPDPLINDEKRKLMWNMNVISDTDKTFVRACEELDMLMTYDDLPIEERYFEIDVPRDDQDILRLYNRVNECRDYMNRNLFRQQLKAA